MAHTYNVTVQVSMCLCGAFQNFSISVGYRTVMDLQSVRSKNETKTINNKQICCQIKKVNFKVLSVKKHSCSAARLSWEQHSTSAMGTRATKMQKLRKFRLKICFLPGTSATHSPRASQKDRQMGKFWNIDLMTANNTNDPEKWTEMSVCEGERGWWGTGYHSLISVSLFITPQSLSNPQRIALDLFKIGNMEVGLWPELK